MRVKIKNKIYEAHTIIYPGNTGKELYIEVFHHNYSYQVICPSESRAKELFDEALSKGYIDITYMEYTNEWK